MTSQVGSQIVHTVGRNIRAAREARGLTQRNLAKLINIDGQDVSRYETGRVLPKPTRLAEIAKTLGRDVHWFYMEHDDEEPEPIAA